MASSLKDKVDSRQGDPGRVKEMLAVQVPDVQA